MRSVLLWTLRQRKSSIIWWTISIVAFIALEMSFYPTFRSQADQLRNVLGNLPAGLKTLIGGDDYTSAAGYLNSRVFYLLLPMLMTILSVGMGGSLLAKEESERTLEQLLARPLTRTQLLLAKVLAMTAVLGIVSVASIVCVIALASLTDMDISGGVLVIATLLSAAFSLTIGMIAFTLTAMGRYARSASLAIASFIGLGGYIISSLSVQVAWLKWPSKLFPFHYYNPEVVLRGGMQLGGVVFPAICVSACIAISIVTFRRRDLSN